MKKILLTVFMIACFGVSGFAAVAEDFIYHGVKLGDSKGEMTVQFGETKVDVDKFVANRWVTYYVFKNVRVGIDDETQKVVDIRSSEKSYTAKNGVKIGATNHKILKEYGKTTKEKVGGRQYYIYRNENQKLMFDVSAGYLEEIRLTVLDE